MELAGNVEMWLSFFLQVRRNVGEGEIQQYKAVICLILLKTDWAMLSTVVKQHLFGMFDCQYNYCGVL